VAEQSTQQQSEPAQAGNVSISLTEQVKEAKKTSRLFSLAAGAVALLAIAAGLTGHGTLAFWCLPTFLILGVAANATNQDVRRLTAAAVPPSVGRQVGEGLVLAVLALFFVTLLFIVWLFPFLL
jgi:hypothetical protein